MMDEQPSLNTTKDNAPAHRASEFGVKSKAAASQNLRSDFSADGGILSGCHEI
jgi:hypothetical protein